MIGIRYRTILVGYKVNCEKINLFYADSFWKFLNLSDRNFAVNYRDGKMLVYMEFHLFKSQLNLC